MTNIEIVEKAVELLNKIKNFNLKIIKIETLFDRGGAGVSVDINANGDIQNFGFLLVWFNLSEDPLGINKLCGMDKMINDEDKLILRLAYYF